MNFPFLLLVTTFLSIYLVTITARQRRKPKVWGNAIPQKELETSYDDTKKKIVLYHNYFRTKVVPPARDMLHMKWYRKAQDAAQKWAEACEYLTHDNVTGRWTDDYGSCGQNIFVANVQVPWFFAIKTWFLEKDNFTYGGNNNDLGIVGHYTQMVWYSSHKVGCGFHYCANSPRPYYSYVCNYCPIGNYPDRIGRPYEEGKPCGECKGSCKYKKLCTNFCPYADLWINCQELNATWHKWLCKGDGMKHCRATCTCGTNTIF